jgi:hypothetical protein
MSFVRWRRRHDVEENRIRSKRISFPQTLATHTTEPESPQNYIRFRIDHEVTIAMAVSTLSMTGAGPRQAVEMIATRHARPAGMEAYERVKTDAGAFPISQEIRLNAPY